MYACANRDLHRCMMPPVCESETGELPREIPALEQQASQ